METKEEIERRRSVMFRTDPSMVEFIRQSRTFIETNERRHLRSDVEAARILAQEYAITPGMNLKEAMRRLGKYNLR